MKGISGVIGGYQELCLPLFDNLGDFLIKTNSARSALKLLLKSVSAKKVWLPAYTCDAVVSVVDDLELLYDFYHIDFRFDVISEFRLDPDEYIILINFFGLCSDSVSRGLDRFGSANVIVDCSQAFFADHLGSLGTIWSPRKFFGLPDGGLLYSDDSRIKQPVERDKTSESRMSHLVGRITNNPELFYQEYLEAEKAIAQMPTLGMSKLTERLLHSVNFEATREARNRNALYLHKKLCDYNRLEIDLSKGVAPLCYPFLPKMKVMSRSELINSKVFVPCYWQEVLTRVKESSFEWDLANNGLFLPCDQRYSESDMDRIISLLGVL